MVCFFPFVYLLSSPFFTNWTDLHPKVFLVFNIWRGNFFFCGYRYKIPGKRSKSRRKTDLVTKYGGKEGEGKGEEGRIVYLIFFLDSEIAVSEASNISAKLVVSSY